jgi:hypothetical protein
MIALIFRRSSTCRHFAVLEKYLLALPAAATHRMSSTYECCLGLVSSLQSLVIIMQRKEVKIMKIATSFLAGLVLLGAVGVSGAKASDGVLLKKKLDDSSNYCHMKFPAIEYGTLGTDQPVLQSADSGDIIDFYGSCDESPVGQDQVQKQELDAAQHRGTFQD